MNPENGRLDYVVALGKNWARKSEYTPRLNHPVKLSMESRMTAIAAGMLLSQGVCERVIFSTGKTAGKNPFTGEDLPSESEEMARYMMGKFPEISRESIELQDKSFDTAGDAEESGKMVHGKKFGLLTVGFHLKSADKLFRNYGNKADDLFKSEEILAKRSSDHAAFVEKYKHADPWYKLTRSQIRGILEFPRLVLVHSIDRKGVLLRKVTQRLRHRSEA